MAIKIGTSFEYTSDKYLDERLNRLKSLGDLKAWTDPLPDGFEVTIEGTKYIWSPQDPAGEFGKWRPYVTSDYKAESNSARPVSQKAANEIHQRLSKSETSRTEVVLTGETKGINYCEVGTKVRPMISWKLVRDGGTVNRDVPGYLGNQEYPVGPSETTWTGPEISETTVYHIKESGDQIGVPVSFTFTPGIYFGRGELRETSPGIKGYQINGDERRELYSDTVNGVKANLQFLGEPSLIHVSFDGSLIQDFQVWINGFEVTDYDVYPHPVKTGWSCAVFRNPMRTETEIRFKF